MPAVTIKNLDDIEERRQQVRKAAALTRVKLADLPDDPMETLHTLKLCELGHHPLDDRRWNLIEQLNQTFHTMASLAVAQRLMDRFPYCGGLRLNPATASGRDVESIVPNLAAAEVFAAVRPSNNSKLSEDIDKLSQSKADNRFVFFYSPFGEPSGRCVDKAKDANITICRLTKAEVM